MRNAHATLPDDEERLLAVIETSGEAVEHFSRWISNLVVSKMRESEQAYISRHALSGEQRTSRGARTPLGRTATPPSPLGSAHRTRTRSKVLDLISRESVQSSGTSVDRASGASQGASANGPAGVSSREGGNGGGRGSPGRDRRSLTHPGASRGASRDGSWSFRALRQA